MKNEYRPQLDGVRAFCIIFTIFNHMPRPSFVNGTIGVDIFFALSGWLITWLLLKEKEKTGQINLAAFYLRRFFRIAPLYYVTIAIYAVAAFVLLFVAGKDAKVVELAASLGYLLTFNAEYKTVADSGTLFGHAWTLGIEEKFYAVWPALMAFFGWSAVQPALWAVASIFALLGLFGYSDFWARGYFGLSCGAALALLVKNLPVASDFLCRRPLGAPCIAVVAAFYVGLIIRPSVLWNLAIAAVGAIMIASLWFCEDQPLARFLKLRPLPWLGTLTYAIYLIQGLAINVADSLLNMLHLPRYFIVSFVLSYVISIGAAWVLHELIELPCISLGRRLAGQIKGRQSVPERA